MNFRWLMPEVDKIFGAIDAFVSSTADDFKSSAKENASSIGEGLKKNVQGSDIGGLAKKVGNAALGFGSYIGNEIIATKGGLVPRKVPDDTESTRINIPFGDYGPAGKLGFDIPASIGAKPLASILGKYSPTVGDTIKFFIESPEAVARTFGQLPGIYEAGATGAPLPEEQTKPLGRNDIGSITQNMTAMKKQFRESGLSDEAATYLSMFGAAVETTMYADMAGSLVAKGADMLLKGGPVSDAEHIAAWNLLGSAPVKEEAAIQLRRSAHIFHPDKPTGDAKIMAALNNAWEIIDKMGIPSDMTSAQQTARTVARALVRERTLGNPFPELNPYDRATPSILNKGLLPQQAGSRPNQPFQPNHELPFGLSIKDIDEAQEPKPKEEPPKPTASAEQDKALNELVDEFSTKEMKQPGAPAKGSATGEKTVVDPMKAEESLVAKALAKIYPNAPHTELEVLASKFLTPLDNRGELSLNKLKEVMKDIGLEGLDLDKSPEESKRDPVSAFVDHYLAGHEKSSEAGLQGFIDAGNLPEGVTAKQAMERYKALGIEEEDQAIEPVFVSPKPKATEIAINFGGVARHEAWTTMDQIKGDPDTVDNPAWMSLLEKLGSKKTALSLTHEEAQILEDELDNNADKDMNDYPAQSRAAANTRDRIRAARLAATPTPQKPVTGPAPEVVNPIRAMDKTVRSYISEGYGNSTKKGDFLFTKAQTIHPDNRNKLFVEKELGGTITDKDMARIKEVWALQDQGYFAKQGDVDSPGLTLKGKMLMAMLRGARMTPIGSIPHTTILPSEQSMYKSRLITSTYEGKPVMSNSFILEFAEPSAKAVEANKADGQRQQMEPEKMAEFMAKLLPGLKDAVPLTPVATTGGFGPTVIFTGSSGPVSIQPQYVEYFRRKYKGSVLKADPSTPKGPVFVTDPKGEMLGIVMPLRETSNNPPSPAELRAIGYSTEDSEIVSQQMTDIAEGKMPQATQKEQVANAIADKAKSIKEVAAQTKILEPNVRRILGMGAKDGVFKRVGPGVYTITDNAGLEHAYIEAGDSVDVLERFAQEGKKFHSVVLDPAYFSDALKGGNRNLANVEYILPNAFGKLMTSVARLVDNPDTHVYLMLSGARTAQPDMELYLDAAKDAGFKVVGEGKYTKLTKGGKKVLNIRGVEAAPERLILLTQSGTVKTPPKLDIEAARPKGYRNEKPTSLVESLIAQSTKPGETVLDPFAGSGSTGEAAINLGRRPTLVEKDPAVVEALIKPRVARAIAAQHPELVGTESGDRMIEGNVDMAVEEELNPIEEESLAADPVMEVLGPKAQAPEAIISKSDSQTRAEADVESVVGELANNGFGKFAAGNKKAMIEHMRTVDKGRVVSYFTGETLNREIGPGIEQAIAMQEGDTDPKFQKARDILSELLKKEQDAGIPIEGKQNYLTQMFVNPENEVMAAIGKRVSLHAPFEFRTIIRGYREGIEKGLIPRFSSVGDIVAWRVRRSYKLLADRKMFKFFVENGFAVPAGQKELGWRAYDVERFPQLKVSSNNKEYSGTYWGPPEVVAAMNNYLAEPEGALRALADFASTTKNIILAGGLPPIPTPSGLYTHGWNYHGWTTLWNRAMYSSNPVKALFTGIMHLSNPAMAQLALEKASKDAIDGVEHGLVLGVENIEFNAEKMNGYIAGKFAPQLLDKLPAAWQDAELMTWARSGLAATPKIAERLKTIFEKQLFQVVIPSWKAAMYAEYRDAYSKYMPVTEAKETAAKQVNNILGGLNTNEMFRSKTWQLVFRSVFLAPDFMESRLRTMGATASALARKPFGKGRPEDRAYLLGVRNFILAMGVVELLNYASSGHFTDKNDKGHLFSVQLGKDAKGKTRYFTMGSGADVFKLPTDLAIATATGNATELFSTIRRRLSTIAGIAVSLASKTDVNGVKAFGTDTFGHDIPGKTEAVNFVMMASNLFTPQYVQSLLGLATGRYSVEEAATKGFEIPFKYKAGPKPLQDPTKYKASSGAMQDPTKYRAK